MPVEALLLPLRMPLFCSFEIIALVGCGIAVLPFFSEFAHKRVRRARAKPAQHARKRGDKLCVGKTGLDDKQTATERDRNTEYLRGCRLFAKQEYRKDYREKR